MEIEGETNATVVGTEWTEGPLRLPLPAKGDFTGRYTHGDTRAAARSQAFAVGPSVALYGDLNSLGDKPSKTEERRFYQNFAAPLLLHGLTIFAVEFVSSPTCKSKKGAPLGIFAIHFTRDYPVTASFDAYLGELTDALHTLSVSHFQDPSQNKPENNAFFDALTVFLPPGWHWRRRRQTIHRLVRFEHPQTNDDEVDGYLYLLAAGQSRGQGLPEKGRVEKVKVIPRYGAEWYFLALRDGIAFRQYSAPEGEDTNAAYENAALRIYIHSLYLDVFILSRMQHMAINALKSRNAFASLEDANSLNLLERDVFEFRRNLWCESATTSKAKPLDVVLHSLQQQYSMQDDVEQFRSNVAESSSLATSLREREAAEGQARTEKLIRYVSAIIGPAGLTYTGAAVLTDPSPGAFAAATAVASVFVTLSCAGVAIWTNRFERSRARP